MRTKKLKKEAFVAELTAFLEMAVYIFAPTIELNLYSPVEIEENRNKIFALLENCGLFILVIAVILYIRYYSHRSYVIKEIKNRLGL